MKMKRIFFVMIFSLMCLFGSVLLVSAEDAAEGTTEDSTDIIEFEYSIMTYYPEEKEYIFLDKYIGDKDATEIVIPDEIEGIPVRSLGSELFAGMDKLQKVVLSENVREIWRRAFEGCTSLEVIEGIQENVEYNLTNAPIETTFADTPWYQEKVKEADGGVVMIGTTVYDMTHCSGTVTIPEGATLILGTAMESKYNEKTRKTSLDITSISIPESVVDIRHPNHIAGLGKLKSVTVNENNKVYYSQNGILFTRYADGVESGKRVELIVYPAQKTGTTYKVPAAVRRIRAIRSQYLTKITFSSNYKKNDYVEMLDYAFAGCKKLNKIILPTYCHLSPFVFKDTAITTLHLPKGVMATTSNTGLMALQGMSKLEKITVHKDHDYYSVVNGALMCITSSKKELSLYPAARKGTSLIIPAGTKYVYSLNEAKNLKTIIVPKSVKEISLTTKTMKSIRTIKYCGTKAQWKEVYVGGRTNSFGEYIGECTTKFTMYYNCKSLSNAKITIPKKSYKYTGKNIKPTVTVKMNGTKLKKGTHYTVSYKNNKKVGTATITITAKGKYYGVRTKTFKITKK